MKKPPNIVHAYMGEASGSSRDRSLCAIMKMTMNPFKAMSGAV